MLFNRIEDHDTDGYPRVKYASINNGIIFSMQATRHGIIIDGQSPQFTDYVSVQQVLSWCYQLYQHMRDTGHSIPQFQLDRCMPLT